MYVLLFLSFCALVAGPLLLELTARQRLTWRFLDAFVLFSIVGIVLFRVLPHTIAQGGSFAIIAAAFGLIAPLAAARLLSKSTCAFHHSLMSIASFGLVAHAILDGFALATVGQANILLGAAIVLHRFPEGLAIWRLASLRSGKRSAFVAVSGIALATLAGFFFGEELLGAIGESSLVIFESLMAGVLLHVVFHRHHSESHTLDPSLRWGDKWGTGVGAFCGFFLVVVLSALPSDQHAHAQPADTLCCHPDLIKHHD